VSSKLSTNRLLYCGELARLSGVSAALFVSTNGGVFCFQPSELPLAVGCFRQTASLECE